MRRWNADPNTRCWLCGQRARVGDPWEPDHVIPLAEGGSDHIANLRPAHRSENRARGAELAKQNRRRKAEQRAAERVRATLQLIEGGR